MTTATDTSYLFAPRWQEMVGNDTNLWDIVPFLEDRDRKLEDFLTALYVSTGSGGTGGIVSTAGSQLYAVTDTGELSTGSYWAIDYSKAVTWWETTASTEPFAQLFATSIGVDKHFGVLALQGAALELISVNASETDSVYISVNAGQNTYYNDGKHYLQAGTHGVVEVDASYVYLGVDGSGVFLNQSPASSLQLIGNTDFELFDNIFFFRQYTDGDKMFYDSGTGRIYFEADTGFRFNSPTAFTYTVDASYNVVTQARSGLTAVENSVVAADGSWAAVTIHNSGTGTATVLHHDGTNNQLDVFAYDQTTYRPIKASAFTVSSSRATKTDIRPYTGAPVLSPVRFVRDGKEQVGFIAEDVQAMFPEASDGTGVDLMPVVASLMERVNRLEHGT